MYGNTSSAYDAYKQNSVGTASTGKLLIMLYDGAIKFCRLAELFHDQGKIQKRNENIIKVRNILKEFLITLDLDKGGDIAKNLMDLYSYMDQCLLDVTLGGDKNKMLEVRGMLQELRDTYSQII